MNAQPDSALPEQTETVSGTGPIVLAGENISVNFGGIKALTDVSIQVPEQSIVGLIGPNGAGKSTLLSVLSGLLHPRRGRVYLEGADVTGLAAHKRARSGLARTYQLPELYAGLNVRDHLVLAYRLRHERARMWRDLIDGRGWRRPSAAERERVDHLLESLGLTALEASAVVALPLGSSRLIEVGRALAGSPRVVLLDEPLSGLDAKESEALAITLRDLVQLERVSFLLIDHDVDTVLARSSDVVVLDFGQVIARGTPAEIRGSDVVHAAYLGGSVDAGWSGDDE
jgi:branched-chain amino acid transport system ATP-binding protein